MNPLLPEQRSVFGVVCVMANGFRALTASWTNIDAEALEPIHATASSGSVIDHG